MGKTVHANNYATTLASSITNSATTMDVSSVTNLPTIGTNWCYLTLQNGTNIEIVKATSNSSTTITIVRAQQGTSGTAFAAGTIVACRPTRDSFDLRMSKDEFTTIATAAGTTTLTVDSSFRTEFTGSTTQNCDMPVATTLPYGWPQEIINHSSGVVTARTSGGNTIQAMAANTKLILWCINPSGGTGTASWTWVYTPIKQKGMPNSATDNKAIVGNGTNYVEETIVQIVTSATGAVATGTTLIPNDDTIPQNTEGDQYLTVSITPTNSAHMLKISVIFCVAVSTGLVHTAALFQDSTADALCAVPFTVSAGNSMISFSFEYVMTAGTTSSTTFNVRAGPASAATHTFNGASGLRKFGGVLASRITVTEFIA